MTRQLLSLAALFALAFSFACKTTEEKPEDKPPDTAPAAMTVPSYTEMTALYNSGDYDKAAAMFAADLKSTSTGEEGKDALVARWNNSKALSPQVKVARYLETDGMWVAQGVMHGTHSAEYHGVAATNKPFAVDYLHVGWTDDKGQTKELLSLLNSMSIASQLGMMPMPSKLATIPEGDTEMVKGAGNDKNVEVANAVYAAYNGGKLDELKTYIAEDAKVNMRAHGKVYAGLGEIESAMKAERNGFSERKADTKLVAIGDYVVVVGKVTAKHTGQLGPTPPTNKVVSWHFADVLKFKDGKLVEGDFYYNPGAIARSLGMGVGHPKGAPEGHGAHMGEKDLGDKGKPADG